MEEEVKKRNGGVSRRAFLFRLDQQRGLRLCPNGIHDGSESARMIEG